MITVLIVYLYIQLKLNQLVTFYNQRNNTYVRRIDFLTDEKILFKKV